MAKSTFWTVFWKMFGIFVFLVVVFLLNALKLFVSNSLFLGVVSFVNQNVRIIILMSVIFMFGEVFSIQKFPFNLPAPIFNAVGALFVVDFLLGLFRVLEAVVGSGLIDVFRWLAYLIYPFVFIVTLIVGYVTIFSNLGKKRKKRHWKKKH